MIRILRPIVSVLTGLIVLFLLTLLLYILTDFPHFINALMSTPVAVYAGRSIWKSASGEPIGMGFSMVCGAIFLGVAGFVIAFVGPMIFVPDPDKGRGLYVLLAGPVGIVVGAIGGFMFARRRRKSP